MKVIKKDYEKGFLHVKCENLDDLWYLSSIIDVEDILKGVTERKIKIGDKDSGNVKVIKKYILMKISVEKIDFHAYSGNLRVSGKITEGPQDVQIGTYHTFDIDESTEFSIQKKGPFLKFQKEKINEASKNKPTSTLVCAFDRESSIITLLKKYGYEVLSSIKHDVSKKGFEENITSNNYQEFIKNIKTYQEKYAIKTILVGVSSFWQTQLKETAQKSNLNIVIINTNAEGEDAIKELLRRPEVETIIKDEKSAQEFSIVERLFVALKRNEKVAYGFKEVKHATDSGAVQELLITDQYIKNAREKNQYKELESLLKLADSTQATIHIISSEHDAGRQLDGIGGIAAHLRYNMS